MFWRSMAGALMMMAALVKVGVALPADYLTAVFDVSHEGAIEKQVAINHGFGNSDTVEVLTGEFRYPLDTDNRWGSARWGQRRRLERRGLTRPAVEVGPGTFKSDPVQVSPHALKKQLDHLIQLQQKQNTQNKDLNP